MKKFVAVLSVLVLASTAVLAAPMMRAKSFGPGVGPVETGFGCRVQDGFRFQDKEQLRERIREFQQDREQIREKVREIAREMFKKAFEVMKLTKEQAKKILDVVNEAKEKLSEFQKKFDELREKARTMTLNEYHTAVKELNQERAEIMQEAVQQIGDIITVEQMQLLREYYRLMLRHRFGPSINFFDGTILEALEEYVK